MNFVDRHPMTLGWVRRMRQLDRLFGQTTPLELPGVDATNVDRFTFDHNTYGLPSSHVVRRLTPKFCCPPRSWSCGETHCAHPPSWTSTRVGRGGSTATPC